MTGAADNTTPTDSRSRRNRASRRGGQLTTRARSSSYRSACPHLRAPGASVPDGRTIRCGYGKSQQDVGSALLIPVNNPLERIMREIRRRTRVVGAFPDGNSAINLAAARLRHIASTRWSTKRYLNMELLRQHNAMIA